MNPQSTMVLRHLERTRVALPPRAPATEQMSPSLDELSLKFAIWMRSAPRPGIDIGCGYGIATAAALMRGGRVMAVDPSQDAIRHVLCSIPQEQYPRVQVRQARVQDLDFKFARFSAVHASRVLHLLPPLQLQQSLQKFFRWLYPDGKLFISAFTSAGACRSLPSLHLLDPGVLRRKLTRAGFLIEELSCSTLAWDAEHSCCNVVARCAP